MRPIPEITSPTIWYIVGVSLKRVTDQRTPKTGSPTRAMETLPVLKNLNELVIREYPKNEQPKPRKIVIQRFRRSSESTVLEDILKIKRKIKEIA